MRINAKLFAILAVSFFPGMALLAENPVKGKTISSISLLSASSTMKVGMGRRGIGPMSDGGTRFFRGKRLPTAFPGHKVIQS